MNNTKNNEEIESAMIDVLTNSMYRYNCVNKRCVRDPNGKYGSLLECLLDCILNYPIPPPVPVPPPPIPTPPPAEEKCAIPGYPPAHIIFSNRCLLENIWGVDTSKENFLYDQNCVFSSGNIFGWRWNRNAPSGLPPIYPAVNIGRSAWGVDKNNSCTDTMPTILPKNLSDISSLELNLIYQYIDLPHKSGNQKDNSYDFSYDIWLTTTPNPNQDPNQRREIMVWINNHVAWPAGTNTGKTFTDPSNNITYNVWHYQDTSSQFTNTTFIIGDPNNNNPAQPGINNFKVDFKAMLDWLISQGYISNNMYLSQIDLGNEIWQSTGKIQINELKIILNGDSI